MVIRTDCVSRHRFAARQVACGRSKAYVRPRSDATARGVSPPPLLIPLGESLDEMMGQFGHGHVQLRSEAALFLDRETAQRSFEVGDL